MQFSEMQTRLAEEIGLDTTADATKIKAWLNEAYKFICALQDWPWLLKSGTVQTVAEITSLTASVNAADTTVTLSTTYASSLASDYMIRFDDTSDDWYDITAHTAGGDALTISPAYIGSSNLAAGSCTIRKVFYSLASDVDRIVSMHQDNTDQWLHALSSQQLDKYIPDPQETGDPEYYAYMGLDSDKYHRITFYPIPDGKGNIRYRYYQRITDMSADADTPLIPAPWHQLVVFVALATFGHIYIDDDRIILAKQRADKILDHMINQTSIVRTKPDIIQPWDRRIRGNTDLPRLPDNYPKNY